MSTRIYRSSTVKQRKNSLRPALSVLALSIAAINHGYAQEAATQPAANSFEVITVTARNRVETAQEVPLPIQVLGGAELQREDITTLWDLPFKIPNLQLNNPNENARKVSPGIRGLGRGGANDSMEQSVGVIVDGVTLYYSGQGWSDYVDLDRIEVLRGPQGTLLGKNTSLGAIKIVTKLPSFDASSDFELSTGDFNSLGGKFSATGPLIDDVLAYRAAFSVDRADGIYVNDYLSQGPAKETWRETNKISGRMQFLWTPTDDFSGRFIVDKFRSEERVNTGNIIVSNGPATFADGVPRPITNPINYTPVGSYVNYGFLGRFAQRSAWFHNDDGTVFQPGLNTTDIQNALARPQLTNQHGVSAEFNWQLGDYTLTSISAYRYQNFDIQNGSQDGKYLIGNSGQQLWNEQTSQELRIASGPGEVTYQGGLYYLDAQVYSDDPSRYYQDAGAFYASNADYTRLIATGTGRELLRRSLDHVWESSVTDAKVESLGVFGQADWFVTDNFSLNVGYRQTWEDKTNRISQQRDRAGENLQALGALLGASADDVAAAQRTRDGRVIPAFDWVEGKPIDASLQAWNVGLSYQLTDDVLLYGSVGEGVKSGFIFFRQGLVPSAADFETTVRPEKARDYELGIKSTVLDGQLLLNANLYRTAVTDYQASWRRTDPRDDSLTISGWGNAPEVLAQGVEFEARYNVFDDLSVSLSGAYNQATYEAEWLVQVPEISTNKFIDAQGQQIGNVPKATVNFGFNYDIPIGRYLGKVTLSNSWRPGYYLSDTRTDFTYQDSYTLSNLSIGLAAPDDSWDVALLLRNAFDVEYANGRSTWSGTAAQTETIGQPQFASVVFRSRF
ncbi:MAG: TonB-dependent receptor [Pseudomonadota bacterium]